MRQMQMATLALALFLAGGITPASAFTIDQATGNSGAAGFADPDNAIPVAHQEDDGRTANFQGQPGDNRGFSFGMTSSGSSGDAFQRAQERMQQ